MPDQFGIPVFSHDVEFLLRVANDAYVLNGAVMVDSESVKAEILDRLADSFSKITPYLNRYNVKSVAKAPASLGGWGLDKRLLQLEGRTNCLQVC